MRRLDPDERQARRPWGIIVFCAALAVYLSFRLVQMAVWLVRAIAG